MNRTRPYLKAAALGSTVLLMGAFVAYRAGALPSPFAAPVPPEAPPTTPDAAAEAPERLELEPAFMGGSKSAPAFAPAPPAPSTPPPVIFMGGSKSDASFVPPRPAAGTPPAPDGKPPTFLGGSKFITIVPPPGAQPPAPKP